MNKRGLRFLIPNGYGSLLSDILEPIDCCKYNWHIDNDEIHLIVDDALTDKWLFTEKVVEGKDFLRLIRENRYYLIFAELTAFPKEAHIASISCYNEFLKSECEIIVLVYDCSYVDIYCKYEELLGKLFTNALGKGYENVRYIAEDDDRTHMGVF